MKFRSKKEKLVVASLFGLDFHKPNFLLSAAICLVLGLIFYQLNKVMPHPEAWSTMYFISTVSAAFDVIPAEEKMSTLIFGALLGAGIAYLLG